jgi:hypothetical protein
MVRSGCQSIASPQATPLTMGVVGACVIMRRYRGGMRSARSRSDVQHLRRFLAAPFEHDGGNAGAIPGCIWQVVARGRHELLTVLGRIDGPGGFAVVETDDPALLARDTAIFSTFFDMTVYPVLDVQDAARIGGEASSFLRSA